MNTLAEHWAEIRELLIPLGAVFDKTPAGQEAASYFHESIAANELEIALHAVCHYLLNGASSSIEDHVIGRIRLSHQAMEIQDDCVKELMNRAAIQNENATS